MVVRRGKDACGIVHEVLQTWKTVVGTRCDKIWKREGQPSGSYETLYLLKNGGNNPINCIGCLAG